MDILRAPIRQCRLLPLLLAVLFSAFAAHGEETDASRGQRMLAASVYKFTRYIHWPDSSDRQGLDAGLSICLFGEDPLGGALRALGNSSGIAVRTVENVGQMSECHVLVLNQSMQARFEEVLLKLRGNSVVTISDIEGFIETGGIIRLFVKNNHIAFHINQSVARDAHLRFDLRLIRLAAVVRR